MDKTVFIRKVASEVPLLDAIPLFGKAPPFNWILFSSQLSEKLGVENLKIHPKKQLWRTADELREGLSTPWFVVPLSLGPLSTPAYWAMGHSDVEKLATWMLNGKAEGPPFTSEILQEGFYRYLLLQAMDAAISCPPFQNFTPQLGEDTSLPDEGTFCIDIELTFHNRSCWGRLMLPEAFRKEWIRHFSHLSSEYIPNELSRQTHLMIGIQTGSVTLLQSDWKRLKPGDFVLLDNKSYDAHKHQGVALLTLGATPLFQTKIKQNKIELLDYSYIPEESMDKTSPEQTEESSSPIKDLPLHIVVEIGRLKLTLDQLLHLQPGNTLELPIHPDQGVSLTVNGQKVGRAELVYLGEALGIRILEVG